MGGWQAADDGWCWGATENARGDFVEDQTAIPPERRRRDAAPAQGRAVINQDDQTSRPEAPPPNTAPRDAGGQREGGQRSLQIVHVEREVALFVAQDLRKDRPENRVPAAVAQRPKITFGNHLRHEQDQQLVVQTEQPPEENESGVTPVMLEQRRLELLQNASQQTRMFLLFLDEQVDRRLVRRVAGVGCLPAQMRALAAFADLESLQRANQRRPPLRLDLDLKFPWNFEAMGAVVLKIIEPIFHL